MAAAAFIPPPYPFDRLGAMALLAESIDGGMVDCSIGTPCDPVPKFVVEASIEAASQSAGYPLSAGSAGYRSAAADWIQRRLGVTVDPMSQLGVCLGTKEFVGGLPHLLCRRDPGRDTVLFPSISYPTYEMGATLAGLRSVAVPLDADWHLDVDRIDPSDARRALVLWINEPGNPSASSADDAYFAKVASWGREHGVLIASDECYIEFAPVRSTILSAGAQGVLSVQSLSKRSNMAGMRCGFYAGDSEIVNFLIEARKHWGFIASTPTQAAGIAALRDDTHVDMQLGRYRERREMMLSALEPLGFVHDGGPTAFYLWLRDDRGVEDGWELAARFAHAGVLVTPGDIFGVAGADHVRLALVQPTERLQFAAERLTDLMDKE